MSNSKPTLPLDPPSEEEDPPVVLSEETKAALAELKQDAPHATSPFLRDVSHLREVKPAPESGKKVHVDAAVRTHPVGLVNQPRVMITPRPDPNAHVTVPSLAKKAALGLDAEAIPAGRTAGGRTLRLAGAHDADTADVEEPIAPEKPAHAGPDDATAKQESVLKTGANWPWAATVLALLGAVCGLVVWLLLRDREQHSAQTSAPAAATFAAPGDAQPNMSTTSAVGPAPVTSVAPLPTTAAATSSAKPSSPPTSMSSEAATSAPPDRSSAPPSPSSPTTQTALKPSSSGIQLPND